MKITSDIEAMIIEQTRTGLKPKYIIIGYNQYGRWVKELEERGSGSLGNNNYMGCDVVICSSDIIEVVAEAESQYSYYLKNKVS